MTTTSTAPSAPLQPVSRGLDAVWGLMGLVALLLPLSTTGGAWIGNADLTVLLMIAGILLFALAGLGALFGFVGVVVAAPLAVVLYTLVTMLWTRDTLGHDVAVPGKARDG